MIIRLPNGWKPRPYQLPLWRYLEGGGKRAIAVWHRRSGKDDLALHWTAVSAMQKPGNHWHMLPVAKQARKAIWEAVNPHTGKRRIDEAFPPALRVSTNDQEMRIRLVNGSTWQVVGSDNYDNLVGATPIGIVFSEWALAKPSCWSFLRPILAENGGWALFVTTPRGRNHAAGMYEYAKGDPDWYASRMAADATGVFDADTLARERREYIAERGEDDGVALYEQEYMVSFDAAIVGSYYGRWMARADAEGRITALAVDRAQPIHTAWDIGVGDDTAIWVWQHNGPKIRVIDYYAASGHGVDHYVKWLTDRGYVGGDDWVPHDAKVKEWGSGRTRVESMIALKRRPRLVPMHGLEDGINAAREIIPICEFDAERCADGIEALRQYRREWDESRRVYKDAPLHDWSSHGSDAFRYLAMAWRELRPPVTKPPSRIIAVGSGNEATLNDLWRTAPRHHRERV